MADAAPHNHGERELCTPSCPRSGWADGPCSVCGAWSKAAFEVRTGGNNDYPACSTEHAQAIWDALDAAQATDGASPWPVAFPPDWVQEWPPERVNTLAELEAWLAVPANRALVEAVRA